MPETWRQTNESTRGRRIAISLLILFVGLAPIELAIFLLVDDLWVELLLVLVVAFPVSIGLGVWVRRAESLADPDGRAQLR